MDASVDAADRYRLSRWVPRARQQPRLQHRQRALELRAGLPALDAKQAHAAVVAGGGELVREACMGGERGEGN